MATSFNYHGEPIHGSPPKRTEKQHLAQIRNHASYRLKGLVVQLHWLSVSSALTISEQDKLKEGLKHIKEVADREMWKHGNTIKGLKSRKEKE